MREGRSEAARLLAVLMARRRDTRKPFGEVRRESHGRGWRIDVRPYGWIQHLSGLSFGENRALAEGVLNHIRMRILDGDSPEEACAPYLGATSPANLVARRYAAWLAFKRREVAVGKRSPLTVREYARYARTGGELDFWEGRAISEITTGELEEWILWLAERGLAPKTQRHVVGAFRTFCGWLRRRRILRELPEWPRVEVPDHAPRILSAADQARILHAIPARERGAHLVAAFCALRPGEIRALEVADHTPPGAGELGRLHVSKAMQGGSPEAPVGPTKTKRTRDVPIPPVVSEWIAAHARDRLPKAPLFTNPRTAKRWSHGALRASWGRGCEAAGVERVPYYEGTKHTAASEMLERTGNLEAVSAYLGHSDLSSTRRYAKLRPSALVEVVRPVGKCEDSVRARKSPS